MGLRSKIFNETLSYPSTLWNGKEAADEARRGKYTMFKWRGRVYAVPKRGRKWNSFPLFQAGDLYHY